LHDKLTIRTAGSVAFGGPSGGTPLAVLDQLSKAVGSGHRPPIWTFDTVDLLIDALRFREATIACRVMGREFMTAEKCDVPRSTGRRLRIAGATVIALITTILVGCAPGSPQAVLWVPGTYVANLLAPPLGHPNGQAGATVLMCLDEPSAVRLETGPGGDGWVGKIDLDWSGTLHSATAPGGGVGPVTLTTPVLEPGCGTLQFWVDCCKMDTTYLAIKATKV
jgi:hypothetical protein